MPGALLVLLLIGAIAVIWIFGESFDEARARARRRKAKQRRFGVYDMAERLEDAEAIREEMVKRDEEKQAEDKKRSEGFNAAGCFYFDIEIASTDRDVEGIFEEFTSNCPGIIPDIVRSIFIHNKAKRVVILNCYGRGEWGFDDLCLDEKIYYAAEKDWYASWQSKGRKSQAFKTKKSALAAWKGGGLWFDFNLKSLEKVKAAHESGEVLNVRYWGGSRSGQDRYVSITELNQLEAFEPGDPELWYAEVKEVDTGAEKTYRVDRMQIVPTNLRDRVLDALEDA